MIWPLLFLISFGSLSAVAKPVSLWGLSMFTQDCPDESSCRYSFIVSENDETWEYYFTRNCTFTIEAGDGMPASNTSFEDVQCDDGPLSSPGLYRINGGWDQRDFITIVVTDVVRHRWAFFAYNRDDINTGNTWRDRESSAFPIGNYSRRAEDPPPRARFRDVKEADDGSNETYSVANVWRYFRTEQDEIVMQFMVIDNTGTTEDCVFAVTAPLGTDLNTYSWFNQPCGTNRTWYISWGYSPLKDSAVMSIVNSERDRVAYFGWEDINESISLPDAGPNSVTPCMCG
ncbi:hypothetical protein NKR23_g6329 [Pleurostoma richardsiae]|uniref:Uncharacterized protein n=1 Tax=Pleurostoma richardsiae TaxID=41990 RepID=A0AA38VE83_9PEZI|nr:hypothetical protein NKR23_g6329 [Pleurostoma richardsiae]